MEELLMKIKKYGNTEKLIYDLAFPIAEELGLTIWDVRFEKEGAEWYLRVFIDKEDGVNIDDCENLSRPLNDLIDEVDPIKQHYIFEVGSAGLGRELIRYEHFANYLGELIDITYIRPNSKFGKVLTGTLKEYSKDTITVVPQDDTCDAVIPLQEVSKVNVHEDYFI